MKTIQLSSLMARTTTSTKQLYIAFILISAASITGPFISFDSMQYHGTQVIPHPVQLTKDIIKDTNYVIVLDGGSTGTRIHIFSFLINPDVKQKRILLDKEDFFYTSPGLSSYFRNSTEAALSLDPLIDKALDIVPSLLTKRTPILLKATAGLRLLSKETANDILENVEKRFRLFPFKVKSGAVSMLEETDEGLFAWYTVNFLLDKLHKINDSIVTLDLGGASTQITFSTYNLNTLIKSANYIVKRYIEGELEFIYTHSYLGNGLMAARKSILSKNLIVDPKSNNEDKSYGCDIEKVNHVKSACFKMLSNRTHVWKQDQHLYHITYDDTFNDNSWHECLRDVKLFIDSSNIDKPEELLNRQIYAMSYFYDRMKDIKVIKQESGPIRVGDFFLYAENVCNGIIRMKKQSPFLCLDMTYIASYLHYGLGIPLNKDITLVKKINGYETSWALGAAINEFEHSSH